MIPVSAFEFALAAASAADTDEAPWDRDTVRLALRTAVDVCRVLPPHLQCVAVHEMVAESLLTGSAIGMEVMDARARVAA